uniref:Uncharacterized protein n=1 Tax=Vespula pensylvanica TaxID=30213 RepID=A0A834JTG0_VESPE|nr:hypothetical protein H0235_016894 [Vespula pensylvanica]
MYCELTLKHSECESKARLGSDRSLFKQSRSVALPSDMVVYRNELPKGTATKRTKSEILAKHPCQTWLTSLLLCMIKRINLNAINTTSSLQSEKSDEDDTRDVIRRGEFVTDILAQNGGSAILPCKFTDPGIVNHYVKFYWSIFFIRNQFLISGLNAD